MTDKTMPERIKDSFVEFNEKLPGILQASLDQGAPITYRNDQGQLVKEMPSGEIVVLAAADE